MRDTERNAIAAAIIGIPAALVVGAIHWRIYRGPNPAVAQTPRQEVSAKPTTVPEDVLWRPVPRFIDPAPTPTLHPSEARSVILFGCEHAGISAKADPVSGNRTRRGPGMEFDPVGKINAGTLLQLKDVIRVILPTGGSSLWASITTNNPNSLDGTETSYAKVAPFGTKEDGLRVDADPTIVCQQLTGNNSRANKNL